LGIDAAADNGNTISAAEAVKNLENVNLIS
jgi:hypothetical protein